MEPLKEYALRPTSEEPRRSSWPARVELFLHGRLGYSANEVVDGRVYVTVVDQPNMLRNWFSDGRTLSLAIHSSFPI